MIIKLGRAGLVAAIKSIGAHPASEAIFQEKAEIIPLKLLEVRAPAVNIIKQEMLAAGGDAVTPAGAVACSDKYMDTLLLGTRQHYRRLAAKLAQMPFFGLDKLADELKQFLAPKHLSTVLADGRKLTYEKVRVMGILNITPDSFYENSRLLDADAALARAEKMLADGADLLDLGAESTRPNSDSISPQEERKRLLPVLYRLRKEFPQAIISVDTYNSGTADAALASGADLINDISAMTFDRRMPLVVEQSKAPIILMHTRGKPKTMQQNTNYQNVVAEVAAFLKQRAAILEERGIAAEKIIIDPGIGFAKTAAQNLLLLRDLTALTSFGYPLLLAASRKSTIGAVLGAVPPEERLMGTLATSLQALYAGAQLVRVHDVKENVQALRMLEAILEAESWPGDD